MITGSVNADFEALIRLKIQGANGQEKEIEAVIDTGFNGFLTLPPQDIAELDCAYLMQGYVLLGDGRLEETLIYETVVDWDGRLLAVETDAADSVPLVGMALMHGYDLDIQAVAGGAVLLRKIKREVFATRSVFHRSVKGAKTPLLLKTRHPCTAR